MREICKNTEILVRIGIQAEIEPIDSLAILTKRYYRVIIQMQAPSYAYLVEEIAQIFNLYVNKGQISKSLENMGVYRANTDHYKNTLGRLEHQAVH
jgi:hypothetical protein